MCVLFTNLSRFNFQNDDVGPEGAESETKYSSNYFEELRNKFRDQLTKQLEDDLDKSLDGSEIYKRVNSILTDHNFYAFKAYDKNSEGYEKLMNQELTEI